jgi:hypothetical protein
MKRAGGELRLAGAANWQPVRRAVGEKLPRVTTKKHLSRRTFLRATGVTLALPLLESMVLAGMLLAW